MKKVVLRYGGYAALAELILFTLTWLYIWLLKPSHRVQGYIGWVDLLCPLLFIYFGMRYYRDRFNDGYITFLNALKIGLIIVLIPAFAYALIETVYVIYIDPKFYENIARYDLEQYRKALSPAAFAVKTNQMKQQLVLSNNPFFNFSMMVLTIAALGTIAAVVSALMLFKRRSG